LVARGLRPGRNRGWRLPGAGADAEFHSHQESPFLARRRIDYFFERAAPSSPLALAGLISSQADSLHP